ncbi:Poly(A) polymerase family protein [Alteracholeplasma palmae J233]|uniref:Poly(A) polymerase family protein n=1 Tax=Alteracholeplasma palmae (strain ATCC 49389 / J233) TaxID=1318466 RepID=U4KLH9_ALTPJ|nr:CCA tRNA nucleotidyltransferase [Alteracholeplasma palmae]CCV64804.1 Poly(A) polymerase family protein [Alteracholeplasma palmae J233]
MEKLKKAQKIIRIFKQKGFEAFIVGGAVRDYVLRQPFTDVDITTNAKPFEINKMFKAKPTGIKYGTVTVFFEDEEFEVTTYRIEEDYLDNRHPSGVTFSDTVLEDVKRRDFRMNGLLMDEKGNIKDYVFGIKDINDKIIQTIGDPKIRFEEDSLRIIRAIYFQSKLGFQIHKETREAMFENRFLINNLANERILMEFIKVLKGKYSKYAVKTLLTTEIADLLPGIKKGLEYINEQNLSLSVDLFFILAFTLNDSQVPLEWKFSNKHRHKYQTVSMLAKTHQSFDAYDIYTYGLEYCILANKVNFILKKGTNDENKINKIYEKMPINSELDLKLSSFEMLARLDKKAGAWVGNIRKELVEKVLRGELKNDKDILLEYVIDKVGE